MGKRTEIMFYVLLASCVLFIAASIWCTTLIIEYPIHIHDTETISISERQRAWRVGDTLIMGPEGSLIVKPPGMEVPEFFATIEKDSGINTLKPDQ